VQGISKQIKESSGDVRQLQQLLCSARLVLRIFFSLNSPGLTEVSSDCSAFPIDMMDYKANFSCHTVLSLDGPLLK
jgi:hypothetical protein